MKVNQKNNAKLTPLACTLFCLPWEWAKCRICHGFDDGNRIGEEMWGKVNLICVVEFAIFLFRARSRFGQHTIM